MPPVPEQILDLIKQKQIIFSEKARYQLDTGEFNTADLIHSILSGHVIKKERDELQVSRYKYTIVGKSISGKPLYSCGKIVELLGKNYFILTFHEVR
ncbi:MAG: hypothetical protein QME42_08210 [bacterium]|nr:hypothetical protein [bacterium]